MRTPRHDVIEQEVRDLLEQIWGTAWTEEDFKVFLAIVDWAATREG